jgi:hypothetical protein
MEVRMNIETPKKKKSFLATKISGFNSFLFWFGKKVYSFLLGLIFIIFIGAGVYAFFAGGESISAPSFEDDIYEDEKNARMEILKEKEKYEKLSQEEKDKLASKKLLEETKEKNILNGNLDLEKKYGKDIESFRLRRNYAESFHENMILRIENKPLDRRDDWFYGYIAYVDDGYEYFSQDDIYEMFRKENGWTEKWDINNWLAREYNEKYISEVNETEQSNNSSDVTRMIALQVMGGSFIAFLIAVLIVIFIQIEANTRLENYISAKSMKK